MESMEHRPGTLDPLDIPMTRDNVYQLTGRRPFIRVEYLTAGQPITIVSGLPLTINLSKLLRIFKKKFNCNGNIDYNDCCGEILRLNGDHRQELLDFLVNQKICDRNDFIS